MGLLKDLAEGLKDTPEKRKERLDKKKAQLAELEIEEEIARKKKQIRDSRGGFF